MSWGILLLAGLLAVRNVSDLVAGASLGGPLRLNLSSVLGLFAIFWAGSLVLPPVLAGTWRQVRGLRAAVLLVLFLTGWLVVGFIVHGVHASLYREWVRLISVIAIALVAANLLSLSPPRAATLTIVALALPTAVAILQLFANLSAIGPQGSNEFFRATGTFVQANKAAQSFLLALGVGGWAALQWRTRLVGVVVSAASSVAILATRSLGGIAAAGTAVVAFLVLRPVSTRFRLANVGALVVFAVVFALSPFGSSRIALLADTRMPWDIVGKTHNSLEWRFFNWWQLMQDWSRQPVLGHGLGSTLELVRPIDFITHSDLVRLLVEGGIVGAGIALTFIGWAFAATARVVRQAAPGTVPLATIMLSVMIGLAVQSLVQNTLSNTALLYMLAAILPTLWIVPRHGSSAVA
jgi:hypothetical protein